MSSDLIGCPFCGRSARAEIKIGSNLMLIIHCTKCSCYLTDLIDAEDLTFETMQTRMNLLKTTWNQIGRAHV